MGRAGFWPQRPARALRRGNHGAPRAAPLNLWGWMWESSCIRNSLLSPHSRDNDENCPHAYHGYHRTEAQGVSVVHIGYHMVPMATISETERSRDEFGLQRDSTEALFRTSM